jgi:antirestriction protein ArdC
MRRNVGRKSQTSANLAAFLHIIDTSRLLKLLKDDERAILTAAAKAEEAASLLLKLGGRIIPEQFDDASDEAALAA